LHGVKRLHLAPALLAQVRANLRKPSDVAGGQHARARCQEVADLARAELRAVPGFSMLYVPAEPQQISQAPTKLSSISAAPESSSRPGSTIARRCLCNHAHAFW
jgi:hypothetical protein